MLPRRPHYPARDEMEAEVELLEMEVELLAAETEMEVVRLEVKTEMGVKLVLLDVKLLGVETQMEPRVRRQTDSPPSVQQAALVEIVDEHLAHAAAAL